MGRILSGLQLDSLESTHPVEVELDDPRDVNEIFDAISYNKGAGLLRQLWDYVGAETFTLGVRLYVKRYKNRNVRTEDLLGCLTEGSPPGTIDLGELMSTWIRKPGYPYLLISERPDDARGEAGASIVVRQQRFLSVRGAQDRARADPTRWDIPVRYRIGQDGPGRIALFRRDGPAELELPGSSTWAASYLLVNVGRAGFYRVLYSPKLFGHLLTVLKTDRESIPLMDRIGLQADVGVFVGAGLMECCALLDLTLAWVGETSTEAWSNLDSTLFRQLGLFYPHLSGAGQAALKRFVQTVLESSRDAASGSNLIRLRDMLTTELAWMAHEPAAVAARYAQYQQFWEAYRGALEVQEAEGGVAAPDPDEAAAKALDPVQRRNAMIIAASAYPEVVFPQLIRLIETSRQTSVRLDAMAALGRLGSKALLSQALKYILDTVEGSNVPNVLSSAAHNFWADGGRLVWNWLQQTWDRVLATYGKGVFLLSRVIQCSTIGLSQPGDEDAVQAFFENRDQTCYSKTLTQCLEALRGRIQQVAEDKARIEAWLLERYPVPGGGSPEIPTSA